MTILIYDRRGGVDPYIYNICNIVKFIFRDPPQCNVCVSGQHRRSKSCVVAPLQAVAARRGLDERQSERERGCAGKQSSVQLVLAAVGVRAGIGHMNLEVRRERESEGKKGMFYVVI